MNNRRLLDTHVHVWKRGVSHPFQRGREALPSSASDLRFALETVNVAGALLVPSSADLVNGHALAAARALGIGFGAIALMRQPPSSRTPSTLLAAGFVGLRVNLQDQAQRLAVARGQYDPVFDLAANRGLPLTLQIRPSVAPMVAAIARRHHRLAVVVDHLGSPETPDSKIDLQSLLRLADTSSVYMKFSAQHSFSRLPFPHRDTWQWARAIVDTFGARRTVWGSNWPMSSEFSGYAALTQLPGMVLDALAEDLDWIMQRTALSIYERWNIDGDVAGQ